MTTEQEMRPLKTSNNSMVLDMTNCLRKTLTAFKDRKFLFEWWNKQRMNSMQHDCVALGVCLSFAHCSSIWHLCEPKKQTSNSHHEHVHLNWLEVFLRTQSSWTLSRHAAKTIHVFALFHLQAICKHWSQKLTQWDERKATAQNVCTVETKHCKTFACLFQFPHKWQMMAAGLCQRWLHASTADQH